MKSEKIQYSWIRETFWPIYGSENWKFVPMLVMMTLALFVYTTLRIHKDTYILAVATANSTSFLKGYLVLPSSILYMMYFCWLSNRFSKEKVFFLTMLPLLVFFFLFYLLFLPNRELLHISSEKLFHLNEKYPNFRNLFPIIGYWTYSLYYVFAELWGTVVIAFLFWGFASYAVSQDETKRFYAFFASYSYIGVIIASKLQSKIYGLMKFYDKGSVEYYRISFINFYLIIGSIFIFVLLYWFVNNKVLPYEDNDLYKNMQFKPKSKPSFSSSLRVILNSRYLVYVAILIICYGLTTNLIEVTWKEVLKKELVDQGKIGEYLSEFYFWTGITTMIFGLINKYINTKFGWTNALLVTPILVLFSSILFFGFILFGVYYSFVLFGFNVFMIAMQFGFYQDILAKSCKYGMFDPNIQASYIPLNDELKIKGKSAVDIVGGRAGKGIASILESLFGVIFNGADQIVLAPIFMPIVLLFCFIWIFFTLLLNKEYEALLKLEK